MPDVAALLTAPKPLSPKRALIASSRKRDSGKRLRRKSRLPARKVPPDSEIATPDTPATRPPDGAACQAECVMARRPCGDADGCAQHQPFRCTGHIARRLPQQQGECVEADKLSDAAGHAAADRAAQHKPLPASARHELCRGKSRADPVAGDQPDDQVDREQHEQGRCRTHRRADADAQAIEEAAKHSGDAAADRRRGADR